jgi:hypothetical protein
MPRRIQNPLNQSNLNLSTVPPIKKPGGENEFSSRVEVIG